MGQRNLNFLTSLIVVVTGIHLCFTIFPPLSCKATSASASSEITDHSHPDFKLGEDLVIHDYHWDRPDSHQIRGIIKYDNRTDSRLFFRVDGVEDGHRMNLSHRGGIIEPGRDTVATSATYRTLNPQYDGEPARRRSLDGVYFRVYSPSYDDVATWQTDAEGELVIDTTAGNPERPADPSVNEFNNVYVEMNAATEAVVHFDYEYRSNHGDFVFAAAYFTDGGERVSGWAYGPHELDPRSGTGTVEVTMRGWERSEIPRTTDGVLLQMHVGGEREFYKELRELPVIWGGDRQFFGRDQTVNPKDGLPSESIASRGPDKGSSHDPRFANNPAEGRLEDTTLADPRKPVARISRSETATADPFDAFNSLGIVKARLGDQLAVQVGDGHYGYRSDQYTIGLNFFVPEYRTLFFNNLHSLSKLSRLRWSDVQNPETGKSLFYRTDRSWNPPAMSLDYFWGGTSFNHELPLKDLAPRIRARGVHNHLIPEDVELYLLDVDRDLPWDVPDSDITLTASTAKQFLFTPDPEGTVLGTVGFNREGERMNSLSNNFHFTDENQIAGRLDFYDSAPAYLMVARMNDYRIHSTPFVFETDVDTRRFTPKQGKTVTLGNHRYTITKLTHSPESNTTAITVATRDEDHQTLGLIAYNNQGERANKSQWGRGPGSDNWTYEMDYTFEEPIGSIILVGLNNPSFTHAHDTDTESPQLFMGDRRRELLSKQRARQFEVLDDSVETSPHRLVVSMDIDASSLEKPVIAHGHPDVQNPKKMGQLSFMGDVSRLVRPGQNELTFRYRGLNPPGDNNPRITGFNVYRHGPAGFGTVHRVKNLNHQFGELHLYRNNRTADTTLNTLEITGVDTTPHGLRVTGRVDYQSDHGQRIGIFGQLGTTIKLWNQTRRERAFRLANQHLLLEPRETFELRFLRRDLDEPLTVKQLEKYKLGLFLFVPAKNKKPPIDILNKRIVPLRQWMD
jgi:hypothetical protein